MIRQQRWTAHSSFDSMSIIMGTKRAPWTPSVFFWLSSLAWWFVTSGLPVLFDAAAHRPPWYCTALWAHLEPWLL